MKLTKPQLLLLSAASRGTAFPYRAQWKSAKILIAAGLVKRGDYANLGICATEYGLALLAKAAPSDGESPTTGQFT